MIRLWRLTQAAFAPLAMSGEGAMQFGGRWNPRHVRVVYAADSLALAALEFLVNAAAVEELSDLVATAVDVPEDVPVEEVSLAELPEEWRGTPFHGSTQLLGRGWIDRGRTALLAVPSAVIPEERNYVVNPRHADFPKLTIQPPRPFGLDPRLRGWV